MRRLANNPRPAPLYVGGLQECKGIVLMLYSQQWPKKEGLCDPLYGNQAFVSHLVSILLFVHLLVFITGFLVSSPCFVCSTHLREIADPDVFFGTWRLQVQTALQEHQESECDSEESLATVRRLGVSPPQQ